MLHSSDNKSLSIPDLHLHTEPNAKITQRKRKQPECEISQAVNTLSAELKQAISDLRTDINNQFSTVNTCITNLKEELTTLSSTSLQIQNDVKELRAEYCNMKSELSHLNMKHSELEKEVTGLKSSANFNSENYVDCKKHLKELESKISNSGASTIAILERKIDTLEQQARQCNIEISNLPEKRGENLLTILESIGSAINMSIAQKDIVSIHRVPHAHTQNTLPKNIIVKFSSRILRDNVLTAYRLSRGLTADRIGLSGTSSRLYINEHLTLRNKELFRKSRQAAKAKQFKFVWVRNATVLVKESEDSPTYAIHSEDDISCKIKSTVRPSITNEDN